MFSLLWKRSEERGVGLESPRTRRTPDPPGPAERTRARGVYRAPKGPAAVGRGPRQSRPYPPTSDEQAPVDSLEGGFGLGELESEMATEDGR